MCISDERTKELMSNVGMPESTSLMLALKQAALEGYNQGCVDQKLKDSTVEISLVNREYDAYQKFNF